MAIIKTEANLGQPRAHMPLVVFGMLALLFGIPSILISDLSILILPSNLLSDLAHSLV